MTRQGLAVRACLMAFFLIVGALNPAIDALAAPQGQDYAPRLAAIPGPVPTAADKVTVTATVPPASLTTPTPRRRAITPEEAFGAKWAPRLDRYLAGSPLAGHGDDFARSAFRHGIDPRLSAAIARNESGLGEHNAGAHNAWGVRSGSGWASWGSWAAGIEAHASLIARVYGKASTPESMARKYCPPTWREWSSSVRGQMARID